MARVRKKPAPRGSKSKPPPFLSGLTAAIRALSAWLSDAGVGYAIVGGVAASLHGRPRVTKVVDVVALAEEGTWGSLVELAAKRRLVPRINDALDFAKRTRVLLLIHEPSQIEIDVSFGMLPFERELVQRASLREVNQVEFPLASPEDIIVMKALALRPRDVADIEGIVELVEALDLERIRKTVAQLSAALEADDHSSKLEEILRAAGR